MYERAKYFIVSEVAHVKSINEREAEDLVEQALNSSLESASAGSRADPVPSNAKGTEKGRSPERPFSFPSLPPPPRPRGRGGRRGTLLESARS